MRVREVRIGETYLVEVPHELPRDRWPYAPLDPVCPDLWLRLGLLRGTRFTLTLTGLDRDVGMAIGEHMISQRWVTISLTDEQIDDLGLPPGDYDLNGMLYDTEGRPVELPGIESLRVPVRWLYPVDAVRPPTHRDLDAHQPG